MQPRDHAISRPVLCPDCPFGLRILCHICKDQSRISITSLAPRPSGSEYIRRAVTPENHRKIWEIMHQPSIYPCPLGHDAIILYVALNTTRSARTTHTPAREIQKDGILLPPYDVNPTSYSRRFLCKILRTAQFPPPRAAARASRTTHVS